MKSKIQSKNSNGNGEAGVTKGSILHMAEKKEERKSKSDHDRWQLNLA